MSPIANTFGWSGRVQSGRTWMRPARSHVAPDAAASSAASGDAWTPAAQTTVRAAIRSLPDRTVDVQPLGVDFRDLDAHAELDAELFELTHGDLRESIAELVERLVTGVDQQHPHLPGIDAPEARAQRA